MALFDQNDFVGRLLRQMPTRWFPSVAPRLNAILQAPALLFSLAYAMLTFSKAQQRIATASGSFLDLAAADYFGPDGLTRLEFEGDPAYRARIKYSLTAPRGTLAGMAGMLKQLTGNDATIFQPNLPSNCGGLGTLANPGIGGGGLFWGLGIPPNYGSFGGLGGAFGTLTMPAQVFITVPPPVTGFNVFGGYGGFADKAAPVSGGGFGLGSLASPGAGGGAVAFIDPSSIPGLVTDDFIYQQIANWMPAGYTAWVLISDIGYS